MSPHSSRALSKPPTAGPRSKVMAGGASAFPEVSASAQVMRLKASDYRIMRGFAEIGVDAAARTNREQTLSRAVDAGKIAASSVGEWRARYNEDPRGTSQQLEALAADTVPTSATASRRVETDDSGGMTYRGFPAALSGGEPCVLTDSGWMTVSAFEASELTDEDLASAVQAAQMFPESTAGRAFRSGPNGGRS